MGKIRFLTVLFVICGIQYAFPNRFSRVETDSLVMSEIIGKEHIVYAVGENVDIVAVKDKDNYNVIVMNQTPRFTTMLVVEQSNILDWAFKDLPTEMKDCNPEYQEWDSLFTNLSLVNSNGETLMSIFRTTEIIPETLAERIDELRGYLFKFWLNEINKRIPNKKKP